MSDPMGFSLLFYKYAIIKLSNYKPVNQCFEFLMMDTILQMDR